MINRTKTRAKRAIKKSARKLRSILFDNDDYLFCLDNPTGPKIYIKKVHVEGWIMSKQPEVKVKAVRVINGDKIHQAKYGVRRIDVKQAYPQFDTDKTLYSGFSAVFIPTQPEIILEVDFGQGYQKIKSFAVVYSPEKLPEDYYNPELSQVMAEHQNLLVNRKLYYHEKASPEHFIRDKQDPRLLAFYLPQFHPIAENDAVWGTGFTEWTNVAAATPRFEGHQQPLLPADLGYYDLRLDQNIQQQIELAKKYGLYGFCFYYYWFSGQRLLERPLDSFLKHQDWDFNFTICWANENWTKRWDGRDNDIIIAQQYKKEDPLRFIKDVEHILNDKRYIAEDGKPVLIVYRASELKDPAEYARVWREYFRQEHGRELQLVSVLSFDNQDPREYGFDAALDFAPLTSFFKNSLFPDKKYPFINVTKKVIDTDFGGAVADYRELATNPKLDQAFDFPTYKSVTPSWDNDARKKGKGFVFQNSSPDIYAQWLDRIIALESAAKPAPLVFLNAWNEWAEGAMLEPSMHLGHATLKRTAETLALHSKHTDNQTKFPLFDLKKRATSTKLAVVVHLYYPEKWTQIKAKLQNIELEFDLFVSLNQKDNDFVDEVLSDYKDANVVIVPNRGRDVLPFVILSKRLDAMGYEYILKLHAKKSLHRGDGHQWFDELVSQLLPDKGVSEIIDTLDKAKTIIIPREHFVSLKTYMGANQLHLQHLLSRIYDKQKAETVLSNTDNYGYAAGTMLWFHIEALRPLLDLYLLPDDFESEKGQIDGTLAHTVERTMSLLPQVNGQPVYSIDNSAITQLSKSDAIHDYKFRR